MTASGAGTSQLDGTYTIDDFRALKRGERLTIHCARQNHPELAWVHDRVAYDCIWGGIELPGGISNGTPSASTIETGPVIL